MADFTVDTIAVFQPLIKKPTLKPGLLQKPPFRFLHDIVTNLQSSPSAFPPPSLFSPALLNSEQVKEKEQKLAFLQRLIAIVAAVNGSPVDVNAGKIIAGLEPEKTNELLRALATAAQKGLTEAEVIERVDGKKPAPPPKEAAVKETAKPAALPAPAPPVPALAAKKAEAAAPAAAVASKATPRKSPRPTPTQKAAVAAPADSGSSSSRSPSTAIALPPAPAGAEEFTATTQRLLGGLITRPTLKPALLQKPPFRFLHDIVTALIASPAHYPADYFTSDESNSGLIDSSEKKVAFLQRVIDVVEATGPFDLSSVNPKKIVAGLEPERTNLLLQCLAKAAASGVTAVEAMAKKKGGGGKGAEAAARSKEAAPPAKSSVEEKPKEAPGKVAKAGPVKAAPAVVPSAAVPKLALQSMEKAETSPLPPPAANADADAGQRLERPMTARQGPPKVKPPTAVVEAKESPTDKADTVSKGVKAVEKKKGVILESEAVEEEDIAEEEGQAEEEGPLDSLKPMEGEEKVNVLEQGNLMRKIIQATDTGEKPPLQGAVEVSGVKGEDKAVLLRVQIQKLCHSIGPLGKCFEFVVDDVDDMGREMGKWRQQRDEYAHGVEEARRQTARVVEPLQGQLDEAERKVVEWEKRIMAMQCTLHAQEQTIFRLLEQKVALDP